MSIEAGPCTHDRPDCRCGGAATEAEHPAEVTGTPPAELVDCPECGEPSSAARIGTWGHCRACRTADSRQTRPLRW